MKKLLIVFVAVLMLVTTGCGKTKTLKCSADMEGLKQNVEVEYDGDDIKSAKLTIGYTKEELTAMGITEDSVEIYASSWESAVCSEYDYDGVSCKVETPNGGLEIVVKLDYPKMSDETRIELGFTQESYDSLKKDFEADGYTCK